MRKRPSWDRYFLDIAKVVTMRSSDIHTQHGCVLVKNNKIISVGYNGFPSDMKDEDLPTSRPEKYDWMIHDAANAVYNMDFNPRNLKAYVTGEPCFNCLKTLWQSGIVEVIYDSEYGSLTIDEDERRNKERLCKETGLFVVQYSEIPNVAITLEDITESYPLISRSWFS